MKLSKLIIIIGILLVLSYILKDYLYDEFWIFGYLPIGVLSLVFVIILGLSILKKNRHSIMIGFLTILSIIIVDSFSWELFKSNKILEAKLIDDLSGMNLVLRENNEFELHRYYMFGDEWFKGEYELQGNKIIFHDKPYDNDFIPDTVTILDDKLILEFDESGVPNTLFASYFEIEFNALTK